MKKLILFTLMLLLPGFQLLAQPIIVDHLCTKFDSIPGAWIDSALAKLDIVYTHTSHGSQLTTGMNGLDDFQNDPRLDFARDGADGKLDLHDYGCGDYGAWDLGNPDRKSWEQATRKYLVDYPNTNVVVWSWCGQVSSASEDDIKLYLSLMEGLERDFPAIQFVYMTGHVIEGVRGNNHIRNEQIRAYCRENNKILYDFADIECYDPDGNYFGDKWCTDGCKYDANGDGDPWNDGANWAIEWQNSHEEGVDWYNCESAHSEPLNANLKAYAAWWLWARLAGWDGKQPQSSGINPDSNSKIPVGFYLAQNYPNPFNATTQIQFSLRENANVNLSIFNSQGQKVAELLNGFKSAGDYEINFTAQNLASGIYYYKLTSNRLSLVKKLVLIQ